MCDTLFGFLDYYVPAECFSPPKTWQGDLASSKSAIKYAFFSKYSKLHFKYSINIDIKPLIPFQESWVR